MPNDRITLKYKPDFERAQKYWDAFWAHEIIDRPPAIIRVDPQMRDGYISSVQPVTAEFGKSIQKIDRYLEETLFLGEAMPGFRPGFGPDQMAAFCGAPLTVSPDSENTSWSKKIVDDWVAALPLTIEEDNPTWRRMKKYHKLAEQHTRGKCLLYNIDMHSNIDLLEGLRGAQRLLFDIIDTPELVRKALADAQKLFFEVYNEFWQYGDKGRLGSSSWLNLYSRRKYNPIQADFICMLNPEMVRSFILPALEAEAAFLDNACFHLDGPDALRHLNDILAIDGIEAFQWVPGAGSRPQIEWPEVLQKIHSAGKATIIYATPDQIKAIHKQFPPNLIVYDTTVRTEKQARDLLDWLRKNT